MVESGFGGPDREKVPAVNACECVGPGVGSEPVWEIGGLEPFTME